MNQFRGFLIFVILFIINTSHVTAECSKPHIRPHVIVQYPEGKNKILFDEQEAIEFSCEVGYKNVSGDSLIVCFGSNWIVNNSGKMQNYTSYRCLVQVCLAENPENGYVEIKGRNVVYHCNPGFQRRGFAKSNCILKKNNEYHPVRGPPVCQKRPQCKILDDEFLSYEGTNYNGDIVKFSCAEGYKLVGLNALKCDFQGEWKGTFLYCKAIPKCVDPGESENSDRNGTCCQEGSSWTYNCHEGHVTVDEKSEKTITCLSNEKWSEPKPICKLIDLEICPLPPKKSNLIVVFASRSHSDVFLSGDEVDFACEENFASNDSKLSLMCQDDGTWDVDFPVCFPLQPCNRPRIPQNGRILELENNDDEYFPTGFEINLECDENYEVRSGLYGTKCVGDKWEDELQNCTRIWCNDPGSPSNSIRSVDSFYVGDSVTYSCVGNYRLIGSSVRECLPNGRWSGLITVCDNGESDCVDPGLPLNSYRQGDTFNKGNIIVYSCKQGFTLFGNATRECLDNGFWSGEQIECYGNNEFSDEAEVVNSLDETLTIAARSAAGSQLRLGLARAGIKVVNEDEPSGLTIYFILDVSKSVTDLQFEQSKKFVKLIIQKIGITRGPFGIRCSVIAFSSDVNVVVTPLVKDVIVALHLIDNMDRNAQGTDINAALNKLEELILAQYVTDPDRTNARSIAFLISDGSVTEGGNPVDKVKEIRHKYNVEFYVMAIGIKPNKEILTKMTPHLFMYSKYKDLLRAVDRTIGRNIDYSPCGLERPDYGEEFKPTDAKSRTKRSMSSLLRIVVGGGKVNEPWPWMAGFNFTPIPEDRFRARKFDYYGHKCGGFIIHNNWIVSAAHCFRHPNKNVDELIRKEVNWRIVVGRTKQSSWDGLELRIERIIIHPDYNDINYDYDIALVKPTAAIPFNHFIRPICLPPRFDDVVYNNSLLYREQEIATVAGWGHKTAKTINDTKIKIEDHLFQTEVPIQNEKICHERVNFTRCRRGLCKKYSIAPTDSMFCTVNGKSDKSEKSDACGGDSGGPLMQQVPTVSETYDGMRWFAIGAVSWGVGCGQEGFYGYYTHVAKARSSIERICQVDFEDIQLI